MHSFETYELNPKPREHKLRPYEDADIKKGNAFKMDDKMKEVHKLSLPLRVSRMSKNNTKLL